MNKQLYIKILKKTLFGLSFFFHISLFMHIDNLVIQLSNVSCISNN